MLTKFGIEHYLPLVKKLRLWSDRKKWVEMPLFNGYVFVRPAENLRDKVLEVPGVVKYLRYNHLDAELRFAEIIAIKTFIERGYEMEAVPSNLKKGEMVEISSGPFKGITAEVVKSSEGGSQVIICFESISHSLKVKLPAGYLKRIIS